MSRALPWTDIIAAIGEPHFEEIRASLSAARTDPRSRDAFLLNGSAAAMLRDLMPEEAPADMISAYGALLHMIYLMWDLGFPVVAIDSADLRRSLEAGASLSSILHPRSFYLQLPERLLWAEPVAGEAHEPLDGVFVLADESKVHAIAVLGFRPGREGFTTMEGAIRLPAPAPGPRDDGSPPFSSRLPSGASAQLLSVVDEHELTAIAMIGARLPS